MEQNIEITSDDSSEKIVSRKQFMKIATNSYYISKFLLQQFMQCLIVSHFSRKRQQKIAIIFSLVFVDNVWVEKKIVKELGF